MTERESGSTGERARFAGWFGYVTLVAACILAFRVLMVWLTYRYFWINGWKVAIAFAVVLYAHSAMLRAAADPRLLKATKGVAIAMIVGALGLILVLANMRIS